MSLPLGLTSWQAALLIAVGSFLTVLGLVVLYLCCSRRYRLNWYQRSVLDIRRHGPKEDEASTSSKSRPSFMPILKGSRYTKDFGTRQKRHIFVKSKGRSVDSEHGGMTVADDAAILPCREAASSQGEPSDSRRSSAKDSRKDSIASWLTSLGQRLGSIASVGSDKDWRGQSSSCLTPPCTPATPLGIKLPATSFPFNVPQQRTSGGSIVSPDTAGLECQVSVEGDNGQTSGQWSAGVRGSVNLGLRYLNNKLTITVFSAHNLVTEDDYPTANPYIKVCLLPDCPDQKQSKIHHETLNPTFNEQFVFSLPPERLYVQTVELLLFDYRAFTDRHSCIGQVLQPMEHLDPTEERVDMWKAIAPCTPAADLTSLGELQFSIDYDSTAERLTVIMLRAKRLRVGRAGHATRPTTDPYVKVTLKHYGRVFRKKKTSVQHNTDSPVYQEALVFNMERDILQEIVLELAVYDDSLLDGGRDPVGVISLGRQADSEEAADHWRMVVEGQPSTTRWHQVTPHDGKQ